MSLNPKPSTLNDGPERKQQTLRMTFPDSETDLEAESIADIEKTLPEPPPWKEEDHSHKQQGYNRETCWW